MLATGSINATLARDREIDWSNRSRAEKCSLGTSRPHHHTQARHEG